MDEFWSIGTVYKHLGYPGIKWTADNIDGDMIALRAPEGIKPQLLMTPKDRRPFCMYKYPQL